MKLLLKIIAVFVVIILLILGAGFYSLFYTAVPAKVALNFLQKSDSDWAFNDISGSLSKGFSVGSLTYRRPEDPSKLSEIKNIGFEYETSSDAIVIKEFHIDSAYLYIDPKGSEGRFSFTKTTSHSNSNNNSNSYDNDNGYSALDENEQYNAANNKKDSFFEKLGAKKWVLKSVNIKDLTIEDPTTGEKTYIKEIQSDGAAFEGGKLLFGKFLVTSNNLDFTLNPFGDLNEENMGSIASIKGRVGKKLYWKLKKDITFSGFVDLSKFPGALNSFNGLNGAIQIINENDSTQRILVRDFTFDEYIDESSVPPIDDLSIEGVYHLKNGRKESFEIINGDFTLGGTFFTIDGATIDLSDDAKLNQKLTARGSSSGIEYIINLTSDGKTKLHFESRPKMEQDALLSKLLFGKAPSEINDQEKTRIINYLK